jgi:ribosomal protein S9
VVKILRQELSETLDWACALRTEVENGGCTPQAEALMADIIARLVEWHPSVRSDDGGLDRGI